MGSGILGSPVLAAVMQPWFPFPPLPALGRIDEWESQAHSFSPSVSLARHGRWPPAIGAPTPFRHRDVLSQDLPKV